LVCPIKYRRKFLGEEVSVSLTEVCLEISERYEIHFLEIGYDEDQVHFLIQSVPMLSPKKIVNTVKSLTAREIFR
jgi:REP element-mobilizing transposase RayT